MSGGLFDLPAGTVQLAGGVSHRDEYTQRTPIRCCDRSRDRRLHSRFAVHLESAGRIQRQGSVRRGLHSDPEGRAVLPRVEHDGRRSLLEVLDVRQHEQLEGRARMASDRRPAAAWHGVEVFRAPTVPNVFGAAANDAPNSRRSVRRLHRQSGQSGLRRRADRRHVPEPVRRAAACRSMRSRPVRSTRDSRSVRSSASRSTSASCTTRTSSRVSRSAPTCGVCTSSTRSRTSVRRAC